MGRFDVDIKALQMYSDDLSHYEEQTNHFRDRGREAKVDAHAWSVAAQGVSDQYEWGRRGIEGGLNMSGKFLVGMRGRMVEAAEIYRGIDYEAMQSFEALNKDLDAVARGVKVGGTFAGLAQMIANPHGHLVPPPVLRGDFADFGKDDYARSREKSIDTGGATSKVREVVTEGVSFIQECQLKIAPTVGDPVRFLAGIGLGFLLGQLTSVLDVADSVRGHPHALRTAAGQMREVDDGAQALREDFDRVTGTRLTGWNGAAARAAKARLTDYAVGMSAVAFEADLIERLLDVSALALEAGYNAIRAVISDLAINLVKLWIPALQSASVTMGASISMAFQVTTVLISIAQVAIADYAKRLVDLLQKAGGVFVSLGDHFRDSVPRLGEKSKQPTTRDHRTAGAVRDHRAPRQEKQALKAVE